MKMDDNLDKTSNLERLKQESVDRLRKKMSTLSISDLSLGTIKSKSLEQSKTAKKIKMKKNLKDLQDS